ncbi:hypothetical protein [Halomonas aquatica]|uniref:Uncharacterized protein n=1 Tax=Halomonas aquatica TaxID=3151123 RepID=A0ABV1NBE3_9GAMM
MPKKAHPLSALEVKRLTTPGFHAIGDVAGLLLRVDKSGAHVMKQWAAYLATSASAGGKKVMKWKRVSG